MTTSDTAFSKIVSEINQLSSQHGWKNIERQVSSLVEPGADILLINASAVSHSGFQDWVRQNCGSTSVKVTSIQNLAGSPIEAEKAKLVIAALVCGEPLNAQELEVLDTISSSRTPGSFVFVLTGAEKIESPEEVQIVERSAWWALVPEPKAVWDNQNLTEHNIFLWSRLGGVDFLSERLQKERHRLTDILGLDGMIPPLKPKESLLKLLNECEECLRSNTPSNQPKELLTRTRPLNRIADDLADIRRQFGQRMDQETVLISEEISLQLQSLQRSLTRSLKSDIERVAGMLPSETELGYAVTSFLAEHFNDWTIRIESYLKKRLETQLDELRCELQVLDWSPVNSLNAFRTCPYPDEVLGRSDLWQSEITLTGPQYSDPPNHTSSRGISPEGLAVAGLATVATLSFFGPVVAAVGAIVLTPTALYLYRNQNRQQWFDSGKRAINREIGFLKEKIPAICESNIGAKKDLIKKHLESIERAIRTSVEQIYLESPHQPASQSQPEVLDRLEKLREMVQNEVT